MQKRILIVDDEPAIREMVAFALRKGDFEPVQAGDAREAQTPTMLRLTCVRSSSRPRLWPIAASPL